MTDDSEPMVLLETGRQVEYALYDLVKRLLDSGPEIYVSEDRDVTITPRVHPDTSYLLEACPSDVEWVLYELLERDHRATVH